ncbi:hypothetical protein JL108_09050 [Aeromicrobium sp. YIM 150415]|uniref:hypothetical protein n=1 Tax=Aeromicrobium sp. YIM 150415 TaxID=2803912 RepID=UPI0019635B10|nr:hypothetical protein [Aeromicrobium sp. YIM 150415]MBM9463598.1 hypothetical protein [Aeromicrobium sp. YIM 150415]
MLKNKAPACAVVLAGVMLAGCSSGTGGGNSGDGVEAGTSKEDYIEALRDVDPIELVLQLPTPPGSAYSLPAENYAAAVEEWSDGQISFNIAYSGSIAGLTEMENALAEGLVDMGQHRPDYHQSDFPVTSYLGQFLTLHDTHPVAGSLQLMGAANEMWYDTDAVIEELERNGIKSLIPFTSSGGSELLCRDEAVTSLDTVEGKSIRVQSAAGAALVEHLGASSVDVPQPDVYEATQRGVIDCMDASFGLAATTGVAELTDAWTLNADTPGIPPTTSFDMSLDTWDSLPLAAQQLLWDRLDVFVESYVIDGGWGSNAEAVETSNAAGLSWNEWDAEASASLSDFWGGFRQDLADDPVGGVDGGALLDELTQSHEKWLEIVDEAVDYPEEVAWPDFDEWYSTTDIDISGWTERFVEEVLLPHRPS